MEKSIVHTVGGPVSIGEIGIADAHTHLWIEAIDGADPAAPRLDDEDLALTGLKKFVDAGGEAMVDCQPAGCGRDAGRLTQLSEATGVRIIACAGFHRRRYYAPDYPLWRMTAGEAYDFFLSEAEEGLLETREQPRPVWPGFIKTAAERTLADSPPALFEAIAAACITTGLAIEMHTEQGADIERFLLFFDDQGVAPDRLIFCHVDKRPDFGLHREMAQAGVMLEYDTFFRPKYEPEQTVWPLLRQMIAAGLSAKVALATDMAESAMWRDPGPESFITTIGRRLDEEGIDDQQKRGLLGGNIIRRLASASEPAQPDPNKPIEIP